MRAYQIGWAPEGWDELARALKLPDERADRGRPGLHQQPRPAPDRRLPGPRAVPDLRRARATRWPSAGASCPAATGPKYKNSTETPIYAKSKVLYGLNWAKGAIVAADEAIVCEGYTDVIGFADAGLPRAVATCGTALTEEHFRTLKSFAHRVVLAFDADAAGQNAAARFYEWERAYEIDVAVAALPAGRRPGRPGPLRSRARWPRPSPRPRRSSASGSTGCSTRPRSRRPRAGPGPPRPPSPCIDEHPNPLVRDQYLMEVGVALSHRPSSSCASGTFARRAVPSARRSTPSRGRAGAASTRGATVGPARRRDSPEVEALRLLVDRSRDRSPPSSTSCCSPTTSTSRRYRAARPRRRRCTRRSSAADPAGGRAAAAPGRRGHRGRRRPKSSARLVDEAARRELADDAHRGRDRRRGGACSSDRPRWLGQAAHARSCTSRHERGGGGPVASLARDDVRRRSDDGE